MADPRKLRILLASDHYPPFIGGAHRWAELTAHGLAARGHEVCVITTWHGGLPLHEQNGDVEVNRLRQLRTAVPALVKDHRERHMPPFPDPVSMNDARGVIARFDPEAAIVHGWMAASVAPILARRSTPVLLSTHDYGYFCATRTLRHNGTTCSGPAPAKCVGCAGEFYGSAAKGATCVAGVAASREILIRSISGIQTVSSFVDQANWQNLGRHVKAPIQRFIISAFVDGDPAAVNIDESAVARVLDRLPDEPFIMFAGALREIKGVGVLLSAYERLDRPPPLVLMGTIHEDTPTTLPAGVTIIENAPHAAVMEGWRRALVGVVPSVWPDPCPTVSIECGSQGTPVIGTVPGGMSDTVGDAGILVPMGDEEALAGALRTVIGDPELRARLGAAARQRAKDFTGPLKFADYERALLALVGDAADRKTRKTRKARQTGKTRRHQRSVHTTEPERAVVPTDGRLTILMVTPSPPFNQGGVERHVREVSVRLSAMGHAVSVVCADPSREAVGVTQLDGVSVTNVAAWPKHRDWRFAPAIWAAVRDAECDLVHVQSYHTFVAPIAMLAAVTRRVPFVLTFHGGGHSERWRNRFRAVHRWLLRPLFLRAAKLIAVAQFEITEYGRELRFPADRFTLIPNGTDLKLGPAVDARDQSGDRDIVLATIGRLERYKGHHRVLAAMPALLQAEPRTRLLVVGKGPYEDYLRTLADTLGVSDRVEFTSVPAGDGAGMGRLLSGLDAVVLLSEFETHPLAALEAAAARRRLLVSDRGGLIEIARAGLARAVPLESGPAELAKQILALLAEPAPTREVRLSSWDECAHRLAELYLQVARAPSSNGSSDASERA